MIVLGRPAAELGHVKMVSMTTLAYVIRDLLAKIVKKVSFFL